MCIRDSSLPPSLPLSLPPLGECVKPIPNPNIASLFNEARHSAQSSSPGRPGAGAPAGSRFTPTSPPFHITSTHTPAPDLTTPHLFNE
eukprot:14975095-Alexandrium_andersonii.AAC.1